MQKGLFLVCFFFGFLVVLFLLPVFWFLCFVRKAQKGYFPAILEVFCLFCSHKRPVLRCFFSSYFVFFCFCLPFQNSILSLCFLAISPFLENINVFGFFLFLFLAFSFLHVCLFLSKQTFLTSPFWNSICFRFWLFRFSVVLVFVLVVYVSTFLFFLLLCWLCFWCCFLFCFVFCFVFFLVLVPVYEKVVFPAILVFLSSVG